MAHTRVNRGRRRPLRFGAVALGVFLLSVLCVGVLPSGADTVVYDALYPEPAWYGLLSDEYDIVVADNAVAITNKRIDGSDNIGWPGTRGNVSWTVDLAETPYLFLDVEAPEGSVSPCWNLQLFTNEYPGGLEIGPAFNENAFRTDVYGSQTVRFDLTSDTLRNYQADNGRHQDVTLSGVISVSGINLVAITDRYNTVVFKQVYIAAEPKAGDSNAYTGIQKYRAGIPSGYFMPRVRLADAPDPVYTMEDHRPDDSALRFAALPTAEDLETVFTETGAEIAFKAVSPAGGALNVALYTAAPLPVSYRFAGDIDLETETVAWAPAGEGFKTVATESIPAHEFTVDAGEYTGDIVLSYSGETRQNERIRFSVYNPGTGEWETVATQTAQLSAGVRVSGDYIENGVVRAKAEPVLVGNGSDTFLWMTDTQHYPFFRKLVEEEIYNIVTQYAADAYNAGEIAYVVHTGDIVEDGGEAEWRYAAVAHDILEANGVPNGVVSGNHDVGNPSRREPYNSGIYNNFEKYFGAWRYENSDWYGKHDDENVHHYDLISLGGYDFCFIYLGMGREASEETAAWVKDICDRYPNRNIILCLHQYLSHTGSDYVISYGGSNRPVGQDVYNMIVEPNPAIKAVLCGHASGAAHRIVSRPDGSRVLEMLHDYQTVDISQLQESTNSYWRSNGDGFVRLMTVADGMLRYTTYSPYLDRYNAYHPNVDTGAVELDLIPAERILNTLAFSAVAMDDAVLAESLQNQTGGTVLARDIEFAEGQGWFAAITDGDGNTHYTTLAMDFVALPESEDGQFPWPMVSAAGLLVLLAGATAVWARRKKKTAEGRVTES